MLEIHEKVCKKIERVTDSTAFYFVKWFSSDAREIEKKTSNVNNGEHIDYIDGLE